MAEFFPAGTDPAYDDPLEDQIQSCVAGIVGRIAPENIKPRWQPNVPNMPMHATNWCSIGVTRSEVSSFSPEEYLVDDENLNVRHLEKLYVLISFYGAAAQANDARLRAGLQISQNRAAFRAFGLSVLEHTGPTRLPALVKTIWQPRIDSTLVLSRFSDHQFAIGRIKYATFSLDEGNYQLAFRSPVT